MKGKTFLLIGAAILILWWMMKRKTVAAVKNDTTASSSTADTAAAVASLVADRTEPPLIEKVIIDGRPPEELAEAHIGPIIKTVSTT